MTTPMLPPPASRRLGVPRIKSLAWHQWQASRLSLSALSGQTGTFTRASTATFTDSAGVTVTAGHSMPRWESRTWQAAPAIGLRMATDDLAWPAPWVLGTCTVLVEAIALGTAQTSGQGLLYAGLDAGTGNRLVIRGTGTTLAVDLVIGANTSTATFPAAVANGASVQVAVEVDDNGTTQRVRIGGTVNGSSAGYSAFGTAIARGTLPAGANLRLNRVGNAGLQGAAWFRRVSVVPGLLSVDDALSRL